MKYVSTRGRTPPVGFSAAVRQGLARDGGLFLPARIPNVRARLPAWRRLAYPDLSLEIMRLFADLPAGELRALVAQSTAAFRHPEVAPVADLGGRHVLELFHGPTLAFKDLALQFLGPLFDNLLTRADRRLNILAATSGDTGGAAIAGLRGRPRLRIFVFYPAGRISPLQERQMIARPEANVFAVALAGSFDDCQRIVKALLGDLEFRDRCALGAVNSINWARLLAQLVYYFYAAFRVQERRGCERVRFTVPTGNFGDVFAGYLAWRMGLPVSRLVVATNENDILARYFNGGVYRAGRVRRTLSPSMDIQVASNFERYLFYRAGEDAARLRAWLARLRETGELRPADDVPAGPADGPFAAGTAGTAACLAAIRDCHRRHGYLLDPHSAVGWSVAGKFLDPREPMICLATAHPAKFPQAVRRAGIRAPARHPALEALRGLPLRRIKLPADEQAVRAFVEARV